MTPQPRGTIATFQDVMAEMDTPEYWQTLATQRLELIGEQAQALADHRATIARLEADVARKDADLEQADQEMRDQHSELTILERSNRIRGQRVKDLERQRDQDRAKVAGARRAATDPQEGIDPVGVMLLCLTGIPEPRVDVATPSPNMGVTVQPIGGTTSATPEAPR
jgi:hypothetical protein